MDSPLTLMQEKLTAAGEAFFLQLPNLIAALVLLVIVWYASKGAGLQPAGPLARHWAVCNVSSRRLQGRWVPGPCF